jgi:hypothetical protein
LHEFGVEDLLQRNEAHVYVGTQVC